MAAVRKPKCRECEKLKTKIARLKVASAMAMQMAEMWSSDLDKITRNEMKWIRTLVKINSKVR